MSNLIKKKLQKARKNYICNDCSKAIFTGDEYLYMFGSAHKREKPYSLRLCAICNGNK